MTSAQKALIVAVVAMMGLWGCAQSTSTPSSVKEERIKSLEAKCARLENESRVAALDRDQAQKRLAATERTRLQLQKEAERHLDIVKERDELKAQLASRTAEREAIQQQFEELRRGMRSLLGQMDSVMPPSGDTKTSSNAIPFPRS